MEQKMVRDSNNLKFIKYIATKRIKKTKTKKVFYKLLPDFILRDYDILRAFISVYEKNVRKNTVKIRRCS